MAVDYGISVTATDNGVSSVAAAVDSLAARMSAAGASSSQFQAAIDSATAASNAAAAALSDGQSRYNELEKAAAKAADSLKKAESAGKDTSSFKTKADEAAAAVEAQAKELDKLKASAEKAKGELIGLGEAQKAAQKKEGSGKLNELEEAFGKLGGPVGMLGQKLAGLGSGFEKMKSAAGSGTGELLAFAGVAASVAVAVVAVVAAIAAGIAGITAWGVSMANAARDQALFYEGLEAAEPALAGLGTMMPGIVASTGLAENTIQGLAKSLAAAGLSGDDLQKALQAAATAEAAAAGQGAKFVEQIKKGDASVEELAASVESKFGGIVSKKMLSLGSLSAKFKQNIGQLFGGLNIEPLLAGLSTLVGLFDQSTSSGRFMKEVFEGVFQPIVDGVAAAIPIVEAFVIGMMIGFVKAYIAVKPIISAVSELVDAFGLGGDIDWLASAVEVGKMLVPVILAIVGVFALLAIGVGAAVAIVYGIPAAVMAIVVAVAMAIPAIIEFGSSMVQAGMDLVSGLAEGITGGAGKVLEALTGVVGGAIAGAKSMLGIASPSKVFAAFGDQTSEGYAQGIANNDAPNEAITDMVEPPAMLAGGASNTTNNTKTSAPISITINAPGGDAKSIAIEVERVIRSWLQGQAEAIGATT
jgi:cytochrome c oxidase subunit IV